MEFFPILRTYPFSQYDAQIRKFENSMTAPVILLNTFVRGRNQISTAYPPSFTSGVPRRPTSVDTVQENWKVEVQENGGPQTGK